MKRLRHYFKRLYAVLTLAGAVCLGTSFLTFITPLPVAASCNSNYVINCGVSSAADLQQAYGSDQFVQHVYTFFKISASQIANMGGTMQQGAVTKSGDVVLNGKTVATNAITAGRENIAGSSQVTYQGSTFYVRPPSVSFLQPSLNAWVVMQNGVFQFAILPSCGNPINATPVMPPPSPYAACQNLVANMQADTATITVTSNLKNGATYESTTYNYGDGQTETRPDTTVTHTYAAPGTYLITARQTFSTGTEQQPQPSCQQTITIAAPQKPMPPQPTPPAPKPAPASKPQPLPNTGASTVATLAGIFVGTTALGAAGHYWRLQRK